MSLSPMHSVPNAPRCDKSFGYTAFSAMVQRWHSFQLDEDGQCARYGTGVYCWQRFSQRGISGTMPGTRLLQGGGPAWWNTSLRSDRCLSCRSGGYLPRPVRWKVSRCSLLFIVSHHGAECQEPAIFSTIRGTRIRNYRMTAGCTNRSPETRPPRKQPATAVVPGDLDFGCAVGESDVDVKAVEELLDGMDLEPFEMVGINRKAFERLLARDKQLLSYTGAQLQAGLKALVDLGVLEEYVAGLVQECPSVLVLDLEEMLMPMLDELDVDRQAVSRLLRYNPRRVLRVQSTNFRKNIDFLTSLGLSKQQVASAVRASPQLLVLDLETEILPKLAFLQSYGVTEAGVRTIVSHFPSILNHNVENNLLPKIRFLESVGVKNIGVVLSKSPGFLGLSIEKNVAPKIKQLESIGFSPDIIGSVIERSPTILSLRFDNMKQKLRVFEKLGFTTDEISQILCRSPIILGLNVENNLLPKIEFLQELVVDKSKIGKVLMNCPTFFQYNLDKHLRPMVAFLERVGLEGERLRTLVVAKPVVLTLSIEGSLMKTIQFLEGIGLELGTPAMARAFSCCLSNKVASMQSRLDWLVESGFTQDEALTMARKQPSILTIGGENIAAKMEFLTQQAGLKTGDIVKGVALLTYSLELRMKPRHRVICWLKDTDRLTKFSVSSAMVMSDERFFQRFIKEDPEAAAMFHGPIRGL